MAVVVASRPPAGTRAPNLALRIGLIALALVATATIVRAAAHGTGSFFRPDDSVMYRAVATDPFGDGHVIQVDGRPGEASYRYGRILLPALAWATGAGNPHTTTYTLIGVNALAIVACITAAALLLASNRSDPRWAPAILASPGLLILTNSVYAEPLAIALILFGYWFLATGRRTAAAAALAAAVLARETAVLALLPLVSRAWRRRDFAQMAHWSAAAIPAACWSLWVWLRVGELPFLASTSAREGALSAPIAALARFATTPGQPERLAVTISVVATAAVAAAIASRSRWFPVATAALLFGFFGLCLGPYALRYAAETQRLLAPAQVLAIVALAGKITQRREPVHSP